MTGGGQNKWGHILISELISDKPGDLIKRGDLWFLNKLFS